MSSENGFIDLRLNQEGVNSSNESFWPSFTDIMTVIVMIFLIALVVLLIRNMELVTQLRSTMEAERMAAELARATGEEKESLSLRLISTENELSELRLQLMKMQEIRAKQLATIKTQMAQISDVSAERDQLNLANSQLKVKTASLEQQTQQLSNKNQKLDERLLVATQQLSSSQESLTTVQLQLNVNQDQLAALKQQLTEKKYELEEASNRIALSDEELTVLRGDYDSLKVKYDKLVRPARTAAGKHVVEVRYAKEDGKYQISYKTPDMDSFTSTSQKALDQKLTALQKSKSNKLYIKVIFPENSGLSYNEAWKFTSQLHKKYDYYFQDGAAGAVP